MTPTPTRAEAVKALRDFEDFKNDVLRSDSTTFLGNLRQLVKLQRESALFDNLFVTALEQMDFESWFFAAQQSRHLFWPDEMRRKLFLQNRLITAIADRRFDAIELAEHFFPQAGGGDMAILRFNEQIVHPYAREYLKLAQEIASKLPRDKNEEPPKPQSTPHPSMEVFISHSSKDEELATAFVTLLRIGLHIEPGRIRCSSTDGYRFEAGAKFDERIRAEVIESRVMIGLITPASLASNYVVVELAARWGANKPLALLLAKGATGRQLPGPVAAFNALRGDSEGQMHQFLGDIAKMLERSPPNPAVYNRELKIFVKLAGEADAPASPVEAPNSRRPKEQENILRHLWETRDGGCTFNFLAGATKLSLPYVEFHATELANAGLVDLPFDSDSDLDVKLTHEGKRYLKKHGLA